MSDESPGPGSWLPDGRRYAPESHPSVRQRTQTSRTPPPLHRDSWPPVTASVPVRTTPHAGTAATALNDSSNRRGSTHHGYLIAGFVILLALATTGVTLVSAGGASATSDSLTPHQANAALFKAATTSRSFHYVDVDGSDIGGARTHQVETGDVGPGEGIQDTVGNLGNSEIIVLHSIAYLLGDETTLETLLEFSQSEAQRYAGKWISFTPKDPFYYSVADLVTAESFWGVPRNNPIQPLPQTPLSVSSPSVIDGRPMETVRYSIHDIVKSTNSSFIGSSRIAFATQNHLPRSCEVQTSGTDAGTPGSEVDSATFSRWGERVSVSQPAGALPFSSLSSSSAA